MRLTGLKPEEALQIAVMDWIAIKYPKIFDDVYHFANERKCNPRRGYILKRMGVKPGVADIFIDVPKPDKDGKDYRGLWMELKTGSRKPTEAQRLFLARKSVQGYCTVCVVGFDAAVAFIEGYLN